MTSAKLKSLLASCAMAVGLGMVAMPAHAVTVYWADLTSDTIASVSGTITAPSGTVGVTYSGSYAFDQLNNTGTNYWTPTGYTQGVVNAPPTTDIIALSAAGTGTITFSHPVQNVFVAFNSWNGADVTFSAPFTIVSQGCGYWGCGTFQPFGGNTGFTGSGETVGVLEFSGRLSSLTFTDTVDEYWHGITVGISAVPEPSTWAMLLLGFAGIGLAGYRRTKKTTTALPAA